MSRMHELENIFMKAKEKNHYVAVLVQMEGFPANEVIINHPVNIESKLSYYKKTYADNLEHKFAGGIRIVDAAHGSSFEEIEKQWEDEL
ncbi:hypothetical protein [Priestia aryabhattai]|uniref:hypothetical protein n=1 Tax=Priestia aryabhattai TaxID=412384 RepID=UPI0023B0BD75|nr:hypothetical protein [Priestia aryabhattai]MDE8676465.1 hypothetical protein [Priestia aryabhattai]